MSKQADYDKIIKEHEFVDRALIEIGAKAIDRAIIGDSKQNFDLAQTVGRIAEQLLQERRKLQRTGVTADFVQIENARIKAAAESAEQYLAR